MGKPLCYNRSIILLILAVILFQIWVFSSFCLTDLDYSLSHLKNADASVSTTQSFHGDSCAQLSVDSKGSYARIYIYPDQPLPFEDLDQFSMWIRPQSGDGAVQVEFYLDGDGDSRYDSKNLQDARVLSLKKSWSEMEMSNSNWNELDGFDLEYEKYKDNTFLSESLDACKSRLEGKSIVKIYISIYKDSKVPDTSAFIDYIKIADEVISFEPLEEEDIKDGPSSATPGGLMTYTITYGNNQYHPVDLIVKEDYDPRTVFVVSYPPPDPGTINTWTFVNLPPGAHGQITIKMRSVKPAARASIDGHVSGKGFASTEGMLSTEFESYPVTNKVHITAGEFNFSASATTKIRPIIGSALQYGEHGAGDYRAQEQLTYNSASIYAQRDILAGFSPVSVNLSPNGIAMRGDWSAKLLAENDYRNIVWSDRYYQAKSLNLSYKARIGKTLSYLDTNACVLGLADRTAYWPNGFTDTKLAGNFTLQGKARWMWANRSVRPVNVGWLECCPLGQG
ncbi:MAG: hypothetical protein JW999_12185 [Methanotrichaceae archaeon]|nr:hypothetical protein [Methanotrichaceae archaeon]